MFQSIYIFFEQLGHSYTESEKLLEPFLEGFSRLHLSCRSPGEAWRWSGSGRSPYSSAWSPPPGSCSLSPWSSHTPQHCAHCAWRGHAREPPAPDAPSTFFSHPPKKKRKKRDKNHASSNRSCVFHTDNKRDKLHLQSLFDVVSQKIPNVFIINL